MTNVTYTHTHTHTHTHTYIHRPEEGKTLNLVERAPAAFFLAIKVHCKQVGGRFLKDFFEVCLWVCGCVCVCVFVCQGGSKQGAKQQEEGDAPSSLWLEPSPYNITAVFKLALDFADKVRVGV